MNKCATTGFLNRFFLSFFRFGRIAHLAETAFTVKRSKQLRNAIQHFAYVFYAAIDSHPVTANSIISSVCGLSDSDDWFEACLCVCERVRVIAVRTHQNRKPVAMSFNACRIRIRRWRVWAGADRRIPLIRTKR